MKAFLIAVVMASAACSQFQQLGTDLERGHEGYDAQRNRTALNEANRHLQKGNYLEALASLDSYQGEVTDPKVYVMRAQAALGMGKLEEADGHLIAAITLAPKSAPIALLRASVTEARGLWEPAAEQFEQAFLLDPKSRAALDGECRCLVAAGQPEEALFFLQSEAATFGKDDEYWRTAANIAFAAQNFGYCAEYSAKALALGAKDEALVEQRLFSLCLSGDFATAVKEGARLPLGRLTPEVQITLGRAAMVVNQPAFAADAFQEFLASNPTDASAWLDLARAQFLAGRIERAQQSAESVLELAPANFHAHALRGHALTRLGRLEAAEAAYRQARHHGADLEESGSWMARLADRQAQEGLIPVPASADQEGGSGN
jgi:tetratricopeptide (TPR) repeat protein